MSPTASWRSASARRPAISRLPRTRVVLLESLLLDHLEDGQTGRGDERIAAEGVDVEILRQRGGDLRRRHHGRQWQAVADALGHGHDLGHDAGALEAPVVVAGAGEAGLHLVGDADAAVARTMS